MTAPAPAKYPGSGRLRLRNPALRTGRFIVYTEKYRGREGNLPPEAKKDREKIMFHTKKIFIKKKFDNNKKYLAHNHSLSVFDVNIEYVPLQCTELFVYTVHQCCGAGTFWPEPVERSGCVSSLDEKEKTMNAILFLQSNID